MINEKIYTPDEIEDNLLPNQIAGTDFSVSSPSGSGDSEKPESIKDQTVPSKRVAVELIGSALNTKSKKILAEFEFTETGAIRVGKYQPSVSGEISISPNGIVAKNNAGVLTFVLDGESGDATFSGTIQAGTLIGGKVAVGDGDILIDGEERRMIFYDPDTGLPSIIIGNA